MATARQESQYALQVKLLELRATDKTIRLYQKPSEMTNFPGSTLIEKNPDELLKYAISERRIGVNHSIHKEEHEERVSSGFENLEDDEKYPTPDFISNQNSLKQLMTPDQHPNLNVLFKAKKCANTNTIDIRIVQERWRSVGLTTGFVLERMLSTTAEAADESQSLHGHFCTTLGKIGNDDGITLAYTAQLDGLEYTEDRKARLTKDNFRFTEDDLASVVEVKSIGTKSLRSYTCVKDGPPKTENYVYELKFLRQNWAQCRLTGLKTLLCGIVGFEEDEASPSDENLKLKEIWNMDVNEIPEIIRKEVASTEAWQRRFPCSIFTSKEKTEFEQNVTDFTPWSEQQILQDFHAALTIVKNEMRTATADQVKYFIHTKNVNTTTTGGKILKPIATKWNERLDEIHFSFNIRVPGESQGELVEAWNSVHAIISDLAITTKDFDFLNDWLRNIQANLEVWQRPEGNFANLKFRSQENATNVWKSLKIQGIACWDTYKSTLKYVLKKSFGQNNR